MNYVDVDSDDDDDEVGGDGSRDDKQTGRQKSKQDKANFMAPDFSLFLYFTFTLSIIFRFKKFNQTWLK